MMLLGGDPQGTFHCGLIAVVAIACAAWSSRSFMLCIANSARLALAVLAVAGLCAIQVLPTWYWYQSASMEPTNFGPLNTDGVPELLQSIAPAQYDVARGSPYGYSIAPWHSVTLVWSNVLGHFLPQHTRYLSAWSAEPRMWTASLSVGLMSLLLSVACLSVRQSRQGARYLWLIVLLSGTAMLGNYAPVWMLRSALRWLGMSTTWLPGDEVGGTYWLLTQLVPGYEAFRYPGKWTPLFAAGLTLCAAHGLDNWEHTRRVFFRAVRVVAVLSVLCCALAVGLPSLPQVREAFETWVQHAAPDGWLSSIDAVASPNTITMSLAIGSILAVLALLILKPSAASWQPWLVVCLVLVEMGWSAHQWLVTTPASQIQVRVPPTESVIPTRIWAASGQANIVRDKSPTSSLADKLQYQSQFALAKLHLLASRTGNVSAFMTLTPKALAHVRHHLAQHDQLAPDNAQLDAALAWLGVQWRLVRTDGLHWQAIEQAAPWIELVGDDSSDNASSENTLHVKYFAPSRIGLHIDAAARRKLIVRLFQDGGWQAVLRDAEGATQFVTPQASHLGLFQSAEIPAGKWDIELRYQAPGLLLGAWISAATLLLLGLLKVHRHFLSPHFFSDRQIGQKTT